MVDQLEPLQDSRAKASEAYLSVLLLSRVVVQLGDVRPVGPVIEGEAIEITGEVDFESSENGGR